MNIQMQLCGCIILILLLYFTLRQKAVGLSSEKLFLRAVWASLLCLCLDITSVVFITYHNMLPEILVLTVCKAYIISLVWVGFIGLIYAIMDMYDRQKHRDRLQKYSLVLLGGTLLIACLPIQYYIEGPNVYTAGPACLATYFFAVSFVLGTLCNIMINRDKMNPIRCRAVCTWMVIWLIAAALQFLHKQWLLVGFASAVGMMILFFELENPEAKLDRDTGAYNGHTLLEYMKQMYKQEKKFSILLISLEDYQKKPEFEDIDFAMKEIVKYLRQFRHAKVFKNVESELTLIFPDEKTMNEDFAQIRQRFEGDWNNNAANTRPIVLSPVFMLAPDSTVANSADEILYLLRFFNFENARLPESSSVCYIDREKVDEKREKERIEEKIRAAIQDNRVVVYYQPIYSTKENKFVSAEALIRIQDLDGSIVPPGIFIPVAEETGLITQLGEIVFDKTCAFIKLNRLWELGIEYIEVNLSVRQCESQNLAETYMDIIQRHELDPAMINLEITETASIQTKKTLVENMNILIDFGVQFSLDDFGSGESNLNYIVDMPVSIVKFDKDMSQAYFENQKARFVMEAAMRMIHDMELRIVSEGIETKEQLDQIIAIGIDYVQGYYFSKPLPAGGFLDFIKRRNTKQ